MATSLIIEYGEGQQSISWSGPPCATILPTNVASAPAATLLAEALAAPSGSPRLRDIAQGKHTAAVLIPGKARRAGTADYVPALVAELNAAGIADEAITIYLADGTHSQHLDDDIVDLLGTDIRNRIACVGHDCHDAQELVSLGTTTRGTPVKINRHVHASDVVILTGRIVPHYFAGWAGGRKAMIPGVAGFETIVANHRLTLTDEGGVHPNAALCSLDDNPVHLDLLEAARLARPDFVLNTIMSTNHEMTGAVAGELEAAHAAGVELAAQSLDVVIDRPADGVIAVAGGLPYDCNLMQALKAPFNTKDAVRPGGAILWIAEAAGPLHPGFLEWAKIDDLDAMRAAVVKDYSLTGHNSIMLRELVTSYDVGLVSALPAATVSALGMRPFQSIDDGAAWLADVVGVSGHTLFVPYANIMRLRV